MFKNEGHGVLNFFLFLLEFKVTESRLILVHSIHISHYIAIQ